MKKQIVIIGILIIGVIVYNLLKKNINNSNNIIFPKLNLCEEYSLDYCRKQLLRDTTNWKGDTSTVNWYLPYIKKIINEIENNCEDTSHLVYPYKEFNEVIFYNNSLGVFGKELNNKQIKELLSIINNPLNFSWGETTFTTNNIIVFKSNDKTIAKLLIMDFNYIISEPQNIMMKFGSLKGEGIKRFSKLLKSIKE